MAQRIELNDGERTPKIGFGTFKLEKGDEAKQSVLHAIEVGYRLIDCARLYGNEASVGDALQETAAKRDELFITSKVWNDRQLAGADEVRKSLDETLTALKLDYLDLFLIHWPVTDKFRYTWEQLQQFKKEGLVRSIGVSNFQRSHLEELLSDGDEVPVIDQMEFHPYLQDEDTKAFCDEKNIVMEAWSPLGRGLCIDDEQIARIAQEHECDSGQVILAWEIARGIIPIPRSSKRERIASNLQAQSIELNAEEIARIDALNRMQYAIEGVDPVHFMETLKGIESPRD